jgi:hypothetical protein
MADIWRPTALLATRTDRTLPVMCEYVRFI